MVQTAQPKRRDVVRIGVVVRLYLMRVYHQNFPSLSSKFTFILNSSCFLNFVLKVCCERRFECSADDSDEDKGRRDGSRERPERGERQKETMPIGKDDAAFVLGKSGRSGFALTGSKACPHSCQHWDAYCFVHPTL